MKYCSKCKKAINNLKIKDGVIVVGRNFIPEVRAILDAVTDTSPDTTDNTVWITDAWRDDSSKHGSGEAFDIRIINVKGFDTKTYAYNKIVEAWVQRIRVRLGPDYDIVYGDSKHMDHIHCEYDPKV